MKTQIIKIVWLCSGALMIGAFNNCSSDVSFVSSDLASSSSSLGVVQKACENASLQKVTTRIHFSEPSITCEWNQNGNLGKRDQYFQARIEQNASFSLPANSTLCDVEFDFQEQAMHYDDTFLIAFNDVVLASAYDWSGELTANNSGLLNYDWSRMAGTHWNHSKEGVYCAGDDQGLANCSWPDHDKYGTINLDYHPDVIQGIAAMDLQREQHQFKFITLGDNDSGDCEHSPVTFDIEVSYVTN